MAGTNIGKRFVMDQYWYFDTGAYIRDYPECKSILESLEILLQTYLNQGKELDETYQHSFAYQYQTNALSVKIKEYKAYIQQFDRDWGRLKSVEQCILEAFFLSGQSAEQAEASITKQHGIGRSSIYERRTKAMDTMCNGAVKQPVRLTSRYWNFRTIRFLKDYLPTMEVLDSKKEELEELEESQIPDMDTNKPNVQTMLKEFAILDQLLKKQQITTEIEAYETYEVIFNLVWRALSEKEREIVDTLFYQDYPSQQAAKLALEEKYSMTRSGIYEARNHILKKVQRYLNG